MCIRDSSYGVRNIIRTALLLPWPWFPGFLYGHTTTNLLRSTMKEVWAREGEVLDATYRCRFRQQTNVNQWLFKYWQLASGNFVPLSYKFSHCYHVKDTVSDACRDILNGSHRVICVNDTEMCIRDRSSAERKQADNHRKRTEEV